MKTLTSIIVFCLLAIAQVSGKTAARPDSDNYIKGVEALNEGNIELAYKLLNEEINLNPDNGYAHCYMALICNACGDAKLALQAATTGLELLPADDAEYLSFAHYTRGMILMNAEDYKDAETELDEAIRLMPNDLDNYMARAEIHLNNGKYEDSLSDLEQAVRIDSRADVYDLMMELIQANPDPAFFDKVTNSLQGATAAR
ncbi:tetratricopeptide repeat protein [uncultured Bacteroides sp.]|uniref:tetratricopeptide repeat protein n=1 Tax=uncultured Bacteroides sp. TaxID=162156 RepID=UPI00260DA4BF|nr:tetratricopeptide repeat protein [uncultured Bacteroides sp.]